MEFTEPVGFRSNLKTQILYEWAKLIMFLHPINQNGFSSHSWGSCSVEINTRAYNHSGQTNKSLEKITFSFGLDCMHSSDYYVLLLYKYTEDSLLEPTWIKSCNNFLQSVSFPCRKKFFYSRSRQLFDGLECFIIQPWPHLQQACCFLQQSPSQTWKEL